MSRARSWGRIWTILRLVMAAAIVAAIVAQGAVSIGGAPALHKDVATTAVNFFSFFTILSNIGAVVVLVWAGVWWWTRSRAAEPADGLVEPLAGPPVDPPALAFTLTAVTTYMIITGLVYNLLLRGIPLPQGSTVAWSNEILHVVGPLFLLVDLLAAPARRALPWRAVGGVLIFPIVWVVYTLVRGPLTTDPSGSPAWWYPYPFLNPNVQSAGYLGVALYVAAIAVAIAAVATAVVWVGRRRAVRVAAAVSSGGDAG